MRQGAACCLMFAIALSVRAADPDAKGIEFFEKQIRPVLAEHCLRCHSAAAANTKKLKGGLQLDTREAFLAGGDSGPVIQPGNAKASLLLKSLHYTGDTQMPPAGKLPDATIADFEKWIAMGAPAPNAAAAAKRQVGLTIAQGRQFWSYQPVKVPAISVVKDRTWPAVDLDRFVLAGLEAKQLAPAPEADKATLIRRVYYDLTGLPPSPEQVDAFVGDPSPEAYAALVDKLLASPAFGERWGRHWLDIARFAESVTLRGFIFKESWRYRDFVIESFNADVPFNRFIREQIAGDLLPAADLADRQRQMIATTFLMMGNTNLEEQDKRLLRMDVVDEQLDVITKGFLAQTVTCARCHDHKFDPIPTRDYYAMAGILRNTKSLEHANVSKWIERPLPMAPVAEQAVAAAEVKIKVLQAKLAAAKRKPSAVVKGTLPLKDVPGIAIDDTAAKKVGTWKDSQHTRTYVGDGYTHDDNSQKGEKTITFSPELPTTGQYEIRLAYIAGESRSNAVPVTVFSAEGEKEISVDMKRVPPIGGRFISLGTYRCEKAGQNFVIVSNEGTKGHVTADCVTYVPMERSEKSKATKPDPASVAAIEVELRALQAASPKRLMAMSPQEEKAIEDCPVHIRGSVGNLGDTAPRGVLSVVDSVTIPKFPAEASGRVELANWIADDSNPLTARVIVNRTWHWLFGFGIVRTVDNFGTTGELPANPALLDHLAARFVAEGWSMKTLIREMVLSRTYRQATVQDAIAKIVKADPENRLFGRANRKRLDAECLRDTIIAVSGTLSIERGGPTYPASLASDYNFREHDLRRSVYLPVFRNSLPDLFEVFDFAQPSVVVGARDTSTVAPQALYFMNNVFVLEQSKAAAQRLLKDEPSSIEAKLNRAYRLTLGRLPTEGERAVASKYIAARKDSEAAWAALMQALFASAEFRHLN